MLIDGNGGNEDDDIGYGVVDDMGIGNGVDDGIEPGPSDEPGMAGNTPWPNCVPVARYPFLSAI